MMNNQNQRTRVWSQPFSANVSNTDFLRLTRRYENPGTAYSWYVSTGSAAATQSASKKTVAPQMAEGLRTRNIFAFAMAIASILGSCRSIKPYEKEFLLNPTMDDTRVEILSAPYGKSMRPYEKLASSSGSGGSTSCPTCGGK